LANATLKTIVRLIICQIVGEVMRLIRDESDFCLEDLLGTLRSVEPEIWYSGDRSLILPRTLGDLDSPEIIKDFREKIRALAELKEMLDIGSITQEDYSRKKKEVLYRI
jgi:hypothetical protein